MLLQVLQVLIFVLPQCLSDIGVLDHVQHGLSFQLQPFVRGYSAFTLAGKLFIESDNEYEQKRGET